MFYSKESSFVSWFFIFPLYLLFSAPFKKLDPSLSDADKIMPSGGIEVGIGWTNHNYALTPKKCAKKKFTSLCELFDPQAPGI